MGAFPRLEKLRIERLDSATPYLGLLALALRANPPCRGTLRSLRLAVPEVDLFNIVLLLLAMDNLQSLSYLCLEAGRGAGAMDWMVEGKLDTFLGLLDIMIDEQPELEPLEEWMKRQDTPEARLEIRARISERFPRN